MFGNETSVCFYHAMLDIARGQQARTALSQQARQLKIRGWQASPVYLRQAFQTTGETLSRLQLHTPEALLILPLVSASWENSKVMPEIVEGGYRQ